MASLHAPISIAYSKRKKVAPQLSGERKYNKIKVAPGKAYLQVYENEEKKIPKEKRLAQCLISFLCDLGGAQTRDLRNRNPAFYSTELRGRHIVCLLSFL